MAGEGQATPSVFEGVTVPDSIKLFDEQPVPTPDDAGTDAGSGADAGSDQDGQKPDGAGSEPKKVKIGDEELTEDDIAAALADSRNKSEWQKKNTEEAQRIAALRKAVEPILGLVKKLKDDGELTQDIREALIDRYGEKDAELIDAVIAFDENAAPNPYKEEFEALKTAHEQLTAQVESEKVIAAEKKELREAHKLTEKQADEVLEFATKKFEETGQALTLEDAFKLMDYEKMKEKAEKKPVPKIPETPPAGGAKDLNKRPKTFADIRPDPGMKLFE